MGALWLSGKCLIKLHKYLEKFCKKSLSATVRLVHRHCDTMLLQALYIHLYQISFQRLSHFRRSAVKFIM